MTLIANPYVIRSVTDIHAGMGKDHYGIIDNYVQRDNYTGVPCIYSHAIKGALKEHCSDSMDKTDLDFIFGSDAEDFSTIDGKGKPGNFRFQNAQLIVYPVRSDQAVHFHVLCPTLLKDWMSACGVLDRYQAEIDQLLALEEGLKDKNYVSSTKALTTIYLDQVQCTQLQPVIGARYTNLEPIIGSMNKIVVVKPELFQELTDDAHLPVIPRNRIEKGISTNLWYDQIVTRESRWGWHYYFPEGKEDIRNTLDRMISGDLVQIGANSSVGYGLCDLNALNS